MSKPTTTPKSIIIIGGSFAGISLSHYLLKHVLPHLHQTSPSSYELILISSSSEAFCRPASPRALISDSLFPQEKLFVSIPSLFTQYKPPSTFRFLHATATVLDTTTRTVTVTPHDTKLQPTTLPFHAIVIATGASTPSPLLGLSPGLDTFSLRESWAAFRAALPTAKRIVIAGGGPSGVEVAGELAEHLNGAMPRSWFFLPSARTNPRVEITLVTSSERILPGLRETLAERAGRYLAALGVSVVTEVRVQEVAPSGRGEGVVVRLDDGTKMEADLYVPCVGTTPNTGFVLDKGLLGKDGRVETNSRTLRVDKAGGKGRVYAIGDASGFCVRPGVHNSLVAVPVLGANIKKDLAGGEGEDRVFEEDMRETQLVPIGRSKGVGAMKGWWLPSWVVWLVKGRDYWLWTTGDVWSGKAWEKE
ncbi:hypothetical protein QBC34DRAFT_293192 [Podospora aff. communis PSN243]|uniref:FAD/NAD(P)-binding domain-containing protein n=1 Tax=Podospora aff. communis PSN243 TaxID=3040156 RepID=A0AAV9GUU4_9PEZI|nr:hypothetical protein QBC34DRAFT_293192 [Podospora aff. communis PSN243]